MYRTYDINLMVSVHWTIPTGTYDPLVSELYTSMEDGLSTRDCMVLAVDSYIIFSHKPIQQ